MHVVVVLPYRSAGCPYRSAAVVEVQRHLRGALPDASIVLSDDGGAMFSRAASLNQAFAGLPDDTVVIASDADIVIPAGQLEEACRLAAQAPGLVQPFDRIIYTDADGVSVTWKLSPQIPMLGTCNVLTVETWRLAGGWHPGFRGWCGEDIAFASQVQTLVGPTRRVPGPARHIYHPKGGAYASEETIRRNAELMASITACSGDRAAMRAMLGVAA